MKKEYFIVGSLALIYFLSKNKSSKKVYRTSVLIGQLNSPVGSKQVYSKVGTKVFNLNGKNIFTYDFAGAGMTITGEKSDRYMIVFGDDFLQGQSGYVFKNSVII